MSSTTPASTSSDPAFGAADALGTREAIAQAKKSASEGGIPIGSALVLISKSVRPNSDVSVGGKDTAESSDPTVTLLAASHNQRIQRGSATLHGETATLELAGRLRAEIYRNSTIVSVDLRTRQLSVLTEGYGNIPH